jgi:methylisocitrate lyase
MNNREITDGVTINRPHQSKTITGLDFIHDIVHPEGKVSHTADPAAEHGVIEKTNHALATAHERSAGASLRAAVSAERPLQMIGAINAYHARMAERVGYRALYLSGGGVAAGSLGVPDLGISGLEDVLVDVRRITGVCTLPLLVDIDTGFGGALNIARSIRSLIRAGAAGCHIEDQVQAKRCGHRPGKAIVPSEEMVDRIKAAVDARIDADFVLMARTDALANEGLSAALDRAAAYVEAGADMVFPEAGTELSQYKAFADRSHVPILANITEFGSTPLFSLDELRSADVAIALYPLSAFRAMNAAALKVYKSIRQDGTQKNVLDTMQTRAELYDYLGYYAFERKLDELFAQEKGK